MTERTQGSDGNPGAPTVVDDRMGDRRAAHERLSTGALARWARANARHPWRVIVGWVVIVAALFALVMTVGGSLKDEFEIPGSDTQKATDLIESEFATEEGSVLNVVFAAPPGQRLDTPERKAAVQRAIRRLRSREFKPTEEKAGLESVGNPFSKDTLSDDGRIAYAEAQFDRIIYDKDRKAVVAVEDAARETVAPAGITAEFNGEAEFPPIEQGTQELLGLLAALIVLLIVFRTFVATSIPIALALTALGTAFLLLFILAGLTDINTITPLLVSMIGIGVGIDYSLFIVTRFRQLLHEGLSPVDAASEAGASAGRAVLFAGLTVAISVTGLAFFGLDFVTKLGIGSALGVLTTVLIANSLLIAVLARLGRPRGIARHIVLYVLTLGVYGWYWAYKTYKETKRRTGEGLGGGLGLVVWILLTPVSAFLIPSQVGRMYARAGKQPPVRGRTGLWLFPFGLLVVPAIVWFAKVQGALNRYWESEAAEPEPAPAIDRLKVPGLPPIDDSEAAREKTPIARWGRFVTAHARAVFVVALLLMLALASTSALVRLGASDQGTQPKEQTARRAYDLLAEGFGPGFNGPIPIVVDVNGDRQAPRRIYDRVQGLKGVASAREPQFNDAKSVAIVFVTPDSAPQDEATNDLVDRLRNDVVPAATKGGDSVAYVSGLTAAFKDIAERIMERLPFFLLYIIGVTFIVLAMAFRSIVISLTAAITTIMSAFVGFGVLTLVVQEGHLMSLTGLDRTGPIETFVPPIAFAILFGLSMDYMVFLMSRIREEHVHGLQTRSAVEHGIAAIGRVVVAAAIIMGTVFAAFILTADRISKEFGLLLAIAILTDALIVRMTLVPAFLTLLREKSWYIPRWLDRLLPNITIESPHEHERRGAPGLEQKPEPEPSEV
ncbi:MAG TPA: MMPL family transporter [Gaiellaceae bacterium]|nr:MMPL family transporter [Gaiellaceae bacterium]